MERVGCVVVGSREVQKGKVAVTVRRGSAIQAPPPNILPSKESEGGAAEG
jgi:hypothetical protein